MELRPYQERAIAGAAAAIRRGLRSPCIIAPTGAGKTRIGCAIASRHLAGGPGRSVLWLAHRTELLEQAASALHDAGLANAACTVASVQTLRTRESAPPATLVVYDEAHHMVSDDWTKLTEAYRGAIRVGLTATPERGDGRGLGAVFDSLVIASTVRELTSMGFLVPCRVVWPGRRLKPGQIAEDPVVAYQKHAAGRQAIVFCQRVDDAVQAAARFRTAGISAAIVEASTPAHERAATLASFKRGELQVLTNVYVLTEGFDAPAASCCILARGCGTTGMFLQMVGRVLRIAPGKSDALLIDLRGVVEDHGNPDDEREFSLEGKAIRSATKPEARMCPICQLVFDGPYCPDCGDTGAPAEPPEVLGIELQKFASKRAEGDELRIATLRRWLLVAAAKGHKPGAALHKYRAVYGYMPPAHILAAARRTHDRI